MRSISRVLVTLFVVVLMANGSVQGKQGPFTVRDEIGLTSFGEIESSVYLSPDGRYFAVWSERGLLAEDLVEDSITFYKAEHLRRFLENSRVVHPPASTWIINSAAREGRVISGCRWLKDSSGVAFIKRSATNTKRLFLGDIRRKKIIGLTPPKEVVSAFDIIDHGHYAYTVADSPKLQGSAALRAPARVGTGHQLSELLFPNDAYTREVASPPSTYLKAVILGRSFEVRRQGVRIDPQGDIALSPDGESLIAKLPRIVPPSWEERYPSSFPSHPYGFHAGGRTNEYVRIVLRTGSTQTLTDAPVRNGGWAEILGAPTWSKNGRAVLLPGTFLSADRQERPCVAIVHLDNNKQECIEPLKGRTRSGVEEGFHFIVDVRFDGTNSDRVRVTFARPEDWSEGIIEYQYQNDGTWGKVAPSDFVVEGPRPDIKVFVRQGLNEPPRLIVSNEWVSRVLWDPNPQIRQFKLTEASIYKWKDKQQNDWSGSLYFPYNYQIGHRYPLVIQTHGFGQSASGFRPSGVYPTAFAARALAGVGIMVLQVDERCPGIMTPAEGPCAVAGYEAAVEHLVSDGLIDPEKIGIIGFSRTCFYVMETLTTSSVHFRAASVTDGVMFTYSLYILDPERISPEADRIIGVPPFSTGLFQWLKKSPGFGLDRINTPLLIVSASGRQGLLLMWEPYAVMNHLKKPVDLVMLNTDEHVLTNPAVRMASQGGTIDWFRFWLQDYEDPDPMKSGQYERWHKIRERTTLEPIIAR